jgi:hypothetical protein
MFVDESVWRINLGVILANRLNDLDRTYGYLGWFYRGIDRIVATAAASRR